VTRKLADIDTAILAFKEKLWGTKINFPFPTSVCHTHKLQSAMLAPTVTAYELHKLYVKQTKHFFGGVARFTNPLSFFLKESKQFPLCQWYSGATVAIQENSPLRHVLEGCNLQCFLILLQSLKTKVMSMFLLMLVECILTIQQQRYYIHKFV
jgi:hypothetical protein